MFSSICTSTMHTLQYSPKIMCSHYRVAKTHRIPYLYRSFFRKSDLYLVALLWKIICKIRDPMSLRHSVLCNSISTSCVEHVLISIYIYTQQIPRILCCSPSISCAEHVLISTCNVYTLQAPHITVFPLHIIFSH